MYQDTGHCGGCECPRCDPKLVKVIDESSGELLAQEPSRSFAAPRMPPLTLTDSERQAVLEDRKFAHLTPGRPAWKPGDKIMLTGGVRLRLVDGVEQAVPLPRIHVTVRSVGEIQPVEVDGALAKKLGFASVESWAAHYLGAPVPAVWLKRRLEALPPAWLTDWSAQVIESQRWLADGHGDDPRGYTSGITSPALRSAGEAVPEEWQEERAASARRKWEAERAERVAKMNKVRDAKRALHLSEATRRRRIDVARTTNSRVEEAA